MKTAPVDQKFIDGLLKRNVESAAWQMGRCILHEYGYDVPDRGDPIEPHLVSLYDIIANLQTRLNALCALDMLTGDKTDG